jgi:hypothetical protein
MTRWRKKWKIMREEKKIEVYFRYFALLNN